ncbi:MAG TPA: cytochrome c [Candidatus Acidoferrum sp.]|nr:cytochrome c [Candidatus Acidoferrum sp.]
MKLRRLFAGLVVGTAVAGGVAVAQHQLGSYAAQNLGKVSQPAARELTDDSRYGVASYPTFEVGLAEGAGRAETQIYCGSCHTARYITMQPPLPAATWDAEVQKMVKTFGATIPEADAEKIAQYLHEHYTPETRKQ